MRITNTKQHGITKTQKVLYWGIGVRHYFSLEETQGLCLKKNIKIFKNIGESSHLESHNRLNFIPQTSFQVENWGALKRLWGNFI